MMVSETVFECEEQTTIPGSTSETAVKTGVPEYVGTATKTHFLSGVVLARNEARTVEKTLKSLAKVCDEIVFVDGASSDGTLEIAQKYSSKVFERPQKTIVETERAFAISKSEGDWIIYLDGDEWLSEELANNMRGLISQETIAGYGLIEQLVYKNRILKWGFYRRNYQLRLYRKDAVTYDGIIHEKPQINGKVKNVDFPILHYNKEPWRPIPQRTKRWLKVYASQTKIRHSRIHYLLGSLNCLMQNVETFLVKEKAFKDGWRGFELNLKLAFYLFLNNLYVALLSEG